MRKILLAIVVTMIGTTSFGQAAEQGNIIINPYYGFPNLGKSFAETVTSDLTNAVVKGYGPTGIRVEYMLADQFGIGIDAIFNGFSVAGTSTDTVGYDASANPIVETSSARASMNRFRIQARFNYHFDISTPELDLYMGLGAGTNIRTYKYYENDVEQVDQEVKGSLIPVSFRVAAGVRYYFTDNIGLNAELGLGGPVVSVGLSFKF